MEDTTDGTERQIAAVQKESRKSQVTLLLILSTFATLFSCSTVWSSNLTVKYPRCLTFMYFIQRDLWLNELISPRFVPCGLNRNAFRTDHRHAFAGFSYRARCLDLPLNLEDLFRMRDKIKRSDISLRLAQSYFDNLRERGTDILDFVV